MGGRSHQKRLIAVFADDGDGARLCSPGVGLYRAAPDGTLVRPGSTVGELEVLGELFVVVAPEGAHGLARDPEGGAIARRPIGYGDTIASLDTDVSAGEALADAEDESAASGMVFRSPTSGRYYARPAPDADPFVAVGDTISEGQTVALLEVMKTFNRIQFGGGSMPEQAKVLRIVPSNEADLAAGDAILELEALD